MSLEQNSTVNVTVSDILGIHSDLQSLLTRMNKWGQQLTQLGVVAQAPQVTTTWPPTAETLTGPTEVTVLAQTLDINAPATPPDATMVDNLDVYYCVRGSQSKLQSVIAVVIGNKRQSFYTKAHLIEYAGQHKAALTGAVEATQIARKLFPRCKLTIHVTTSYLVKQTSGLKPIAAHFCLWNHFNSIRLSAKEAGIPIAFAETNWHDKNPHRQSSRMLADQAIRQLNIG